MKIRILAIILISMSLGLSSCAGSKKTLVVEETTKVAMPPDALWKCSDISPPPKGEYTQAEVADYVLRLYEAQQVCKASLEAVKQYLIDAKKITEENN